MFIRILLLLLLTVTSTFAQTTIKASTNQGYSDYAIIRFDTAATDGYDFNYDGLKFPSQNGYPTAYTIDSVTNAWYSINTLKPVNTKIKYVKFNVLPGNGTTINLTFSGFDLLEGYTVLHDTYSNIFQFVNSDSTYSYNVVAGSEARFVLMYNPKPIIFIDSATCINPFSKIKLSLQDTASLDMYFNMYNSNLTYLQTGHFNSVQSFYSFIPQGTYTLKLAPITPNTYLNNSIKTYSFHIDSIPNIQLNINSLFPFLNVNQEAAIAVNFSPSNFYAELSFGDGTSIKPDSGSMNHHLYSMPGIYTIQLTIFDTIHNCKQTVIDTIVVQSTDIPSHEFTQGKLFYSNGYICLIPNSDITGILSLYDMSARLVNSIDVSMLKNINYRLEAGNIAAGVYVVELLYNKKRYYKKIIKT